MSLKEKLDRQEKGFEKIAPQEAKDIMHQATEDLKKFGIMNDVIKIGDKAPVVYS